MSFDLFWFEKKKLGEKKCELIFLVYDRSKRVGFKLYFLSGVGNVYLEDQSVIFLIDLCMASMRIYFI